MKYSQQLRLIFHLRRARTIFKYSKNVNILFIIIDKFLFILLTNLFTVHQSYKVLFMILLSNINSSYENILQRTWSEKFDTYIRLLNSSALEKFPLCSPWQAYGFYELKNYNTILFSIRFPSMYCKTYHYSGRQWQPKICLLFRCAQTLPFALVNLGHVRRL